MSIEVVTLVIVAVTASLLRSNQTAASSPDEGVVSMDWHGNNGIPRRFSYGMCCVVAYITLTLAGPLVLLISWLIIAS